MGTRKKMVEKLLNDWKVGEDMTKEELQAIREQFELNGITCWMGEYKALHRTLDALEQAQAEHENWMDSLRSDTQKILHYRQLLNEALNEINNVYLRKRICEALEGSE